MDSGSNQYLAPATIPQLELFSIDCCSLYHIENDTKQLVIFNDKLIVSLIQMPSNLIVLTLGKFQYSLSPEIPVIRDANQYVYVFPEFESYYGIFIPEKTEPIKIAKLEHILEENSDFAILVEQQQEIEISAKEKEKLVMAKSTKKEKIFGILRKGADYLKKALTKGAEIISIGIQKGSSFLIRKVIKKKAQPFKVSKSSQEMMKGAKGVTGALVGISKEAVNLLVKKSGEIGAKIISQVKKQDTIKSGQEEQKKGDNKKLINEVGKEAIYVVGTIYDGVITAMHTLTKGATEAVVNVVAHRYGDEAAELAKTGVEVGNDIMKIKNLKNGMIAQFVNSSANQIYKEAKKGFEEDEKK